VKMKVRSQLSSVPPTGVASVSLRVMAMVLQTASHRRAPHHLSTRASRQHYPFRSLHLLFPPHPSSGLHLNVPFPVTPGYSDLDAPPTRLPCLIVCLSLYLCVCDLESMVSSWAHLLPRGRIGFSA
jgi:hypothetical protein